MNRVKKIGIVSVLLNLCTGLSIAHGYDPYTDDAGVTINGAGTMNIGREVGRCEMTVCTKHENNYGGGTCVAYKTVPMFTLELLEDGYIRVLNTDPRPTVVIEAKPEFKLWTTISSMRIGNPYEGHGISISYYLELPDKELTFPKKNMLGYTILPGYLNPSTTCTIYEDLGFLPYKKPQ